MQADTDGAEVDEHNRRLYKVARRGFPMNPQEVYDLVALVNDRRAAPIDRAEGFLLITELRRIATLSVDQRRDRSMSVLLSDDYASPNFLAPYPQKDAIWTHEPLTPDPSSWNTASRRSGPGLPIPDAEQPFALADWARYILYHGRPGTANQFVGIAITYALQVHYRSVFGFQLGRALGPSNPSARASFLRHYVRIVAVPGRYADHLAETMGQHSGEPPVTPPDTVTLTRMDLGDRRAADITIDDVLTTLSTNHVPLAWVDHAYTFGLHYLNHHYNGPSPASSMYREIDDERLHWLGVHGLPPAIPEWDGWYTPSDEDVSRVNALRAVEEERDQFCQDDSRDWLMVGEDPHFDQLHARRNGSDPTVNWNQPTGEAGDVDPIGQELPFAEMDLDPGNGHGDEPADNPPT
jgi:hypothetical protein